MKNYKKIVASFLALATALSLTACASHPELKGKEDYIAASNKYASKIKSYDMDCKVVLDVKEDLERTKMTGEMKASYFFEPMQVGLVMTTDTNGKKSTDLKTYLAPTEDGTMVLYLYVDKEWLAVPLEEELFNPEMLSKELGIDLQAMSDEFVKSNLDNFAIVGDTVYNGLETTIVEGTINGDSIKNFLKSSSMIAFLGDVASDEEVGSLIDELFAQGIKVKMWVYDWNLFPVKYEMDFTDMFNGFMKRMASEEVANKNGSEAAQKKAADAVQVNTYRIEVCFKNLNNATPITVPADALEAYENSLTAVAPSTDTTTVAEPKETAPAPTATPEAAATTDAATTTDAAATTDAATAAATAAPEASATPVATEKPAA